MSKAEEKSKQYRDFREQCGIKDPVMLDEIEEAYFEGYHQAEKELTDKARLSSGWDGFYYGQGYKQAEKDLELTWKDIADILDVTDIIANDDSMDGRLKTMSEEEYCQVVLKRYKDFKERKEK